MNSVNYFLSKPFINGFLKGFTAPLILFNRMDAPTIPAVKEISVSDIGIDQGINGDFIKVGGDMRKDLSKSLTLLGQTPDNKKAVNYDE